MGYVHMYYGDGKGKTTAAMGLALRAAGNGMRVVIMQFLKSRPSGEVRMLEGMEGVRVFRGKAGDGFTWSMTPEQREETCAIHEDNFRQACSWVRHDARLFILDEILGAIEYGFFPVQQLLDYLEHVPEDVDIVLTGRPLLPKIAERADYITQMASIRHPYDKGVQARKGIEY